MKCGWLLRQVNRSGTYTHPRDCQVSWTWQILGSVNFSCLHRMWHSFSSFHTRSKKSAWGTWKEFDEVTATFLALSTGWVELNANHVASLEQWTIYHTVVWSQFECSEHTWSTSRVVHEERAGTWMLVLQQEKSLCNIAREMCIKMDTAVERCCKAPCVCFSWRAGWVDPQNWKPMWTLFPEASTASRELICCDCKKRMCRTV